MQADCLFLFAIGVAFGIGNEEGDWAFSDPDSDNDFPHKIRVLPG